MIDPATFLQRAGFSCSSWSALPWANRVPEAAAFMAFGKTVREGARFTEEFIENLAQSETNAVWRRGAQLATQIDAYCLAWAVEQQRQRRASHAQAVLGQARSVAVRPAGDAAPATTATPATATAQSNSELQAALVSLSGNATVLRLAVVALGGGLAYVAWQNFKLRRELQATHVGHARARAARAAAWKTLQET